MAKIRASACTLGLALCACGSRSALDTEGSYPNGDGGLGGRATTSGGSSPTGGRASSGGAIGAGGNRPFTGGAGPAGGVGPIGAGGGGDGGASPVGGGPGYCAAGTYDADTGYGVDCEPWTDCEPGEYVTYSPSSVQDRLCFPCAPHAYSSYFNAYSCVYGGCEFDELEVTSSTPTSPATCAPDPRFDAIPFNEMVNYGWFMGLSKGATSAYAGFFVGGVEPKLNVYEYLNGARINTRSLSAQPSELPSAFTTGLDGSAFLLTQSSDEYAYGYRYSRVFAWAPDGSARPSWQPTPELGDGVPWFTSFAATDSHVLVWGPPQYGQAGLVFPLGETDQNNLVHDLSYRDLPFHISSAVADDNEGLWAVTSSLSGYETEVHRFDSINGTPQSVGKFDAYAELRVAAAPDGRGYVTFVEGGLIRTLEFSTDGEPLRNWSTPIPDELNSNFILLATDVISDGSIIFAGSYGNGYPYTGSTYSDVFAARINMGSGAAEFQRFAGPNPDYLYYLTATRNGEVYIGGFTNLGPTSNRETQYVRQVW